MHEFDFIDQCLKPLCATPHALDDDTSVVIGGQALIVNTDSIVEGRHFLPSDPADSVAKKLVRINVSDLASTGAQPKYLSLALSLGATADERWIRAFAVGLAEELTEFDLRLLGGDTTRTDGACVLSASMIGDMEARRPMRRWQARSGDDVWLGRPLGLGGLGLADAQLGRSSPYAWRYWVPSPQLDLGLTLSGLDARIACADVSDGLGRDLGHIARASGVRIELDHVPVEPGGDMNAGDDYCLVAVTDQDLSLFGMTKIGRAKPGDASVIFEGQDISRIGYEHR